ncbi:hypothetical protein FNF27_01413 [Cafeteria roenbergensis]|uniref:Guanylate cyclase domain-containing protein n=1 Tax=Cafeteria roenbergensis TaxID=33653 RepID=A0A5A8EGQ4_CAFRO|nr:hypothetical protein FNF29_08279 [Cafeteria roenbergensis]KAA0177083.1 hypothetical protein FNF27_01413 [Cafeteria roenbergensis]|eukprot:KAA0146043.1 hypothetical protein FNF29_08279 [Cafeteria roenbergensis]
MVSKDHISRAGRRASLALATSDDAGTSSLFHDIEAQKRQALDVARTAIISAEVARWAAVRLSRVRYAAALVVLEVGVIAARLFSDDVTDWPLGLIVVISSCEMALLISMLIAAWLSSHKLRWASDGLTVVTYLVGIVLVPSLSIASGERPGTFSLFVLTLIVYAYPKAFVTPAAYVDVGFVAVIVVMVISTVSQLLSTGVAYETFANGVIVLNFALASFIPQRQNQVMRHELVRLFATMEMESHTQLLLLQRVIPRVFLAELIKDERIVSTAKRVAVLFCEVMAPDHAQGDGLHKLGNNVHSGTLRTLSRVFKVIDGVMDRHGVFKVETIGSEYMAVSGLPVQCLHPRNPVFALIRASTDMLDAVHDDPICRAKGITLQIGINSGTTVEAILGRRLLPRWKLFGDTVNTASRIKSAGAPGLIHLSAAAQDRVRS